MTRAHPTLEGGPVPGPDVRRDPRQTLPEIMRIAAAGLFPSPAALEAMLDRIERMP